MADAPRFHADDDVAALRAIAEGTAQAIGDAFFRSPGFERKLRVAIDWTLDLVFPRDIVYLRPLHSARGPGAVSLAAHEFEGEACRRDAVPQSIGDFPTMLADAELEGIAR